MSTDKCEHLSVNEQSSNDEVKAGCAEGPEGHATHESEETREKNKEQHGEPTEGEKHGHKRSADAAEVQSVNDWEHVDMGGDDGRKSKFLRLMGANKKEHKGRFVIGDRKPASASGGHARTNIDAEKLTEDLESQYCQGLDHKLSGGARRHTGLGFRPPTPPPTYTDPETCSLQSEDSTNDTPFYGPAPERFSDDRSTGSWHSNRDDSSADRDFARMGNAEKTETKSDKSNGAKAVYGFVKSSDSS